MGTQQAKAEEDLGDDASGTCEDLRGIRGESLEKRMGNELSRLQ